VILAIIISTAINSGGNVGRIDKDFGIDANQLFSYLGAGRRLANSHSEAGYKFCNMLFPFRTEEPDREFFCFGSCRNGSVKLKRSLGTPVCERSRYSVNGSDALEKTATCPVNYSAIMDENECRRAARCLEYCDGREFREGIQNNSAYHEYPEGCFIHHNDTNALGTPCVYFNPPSEIMGQPLRPRGTPICNVAMPTNFARDAIGSNGTLEKSGSEKGLSLLTFAALSGLTNLEEPEFDEAFRRELPRWKKLYEHRADFESGEDYTTFFEFADPEDTTTVFAIRGTKGKFDLVQDLTIWLPIIVAQMAALVGPMLTSALQDSLFFISKWISSDTGEHYAVFMQHVKTKVRQNKSRRYYFTGHSLGGGLASLAALETGNIAVTFSSPGLRKTSQWHLSKTSVVNRQDVLTAAPRLLNNVISSNDLVPMIDDQIGNLLRISCGQSLWGCHMISSTLEELNRQCTL
jgi:hypothetical protein